MVLGLMYGDYYIDDKEKYPEAYRLAKNQHNLNIWTNDAAIIGTNYGKWFYNENNDDDKEIFGFIKKIKIEDSVYCNSNVNFGDFKDFSSFLQRIIGSMKD